jgi:hypothetical protein
MYIVVGNGLGQPYEQRCPVDLESAPTEEGKLERLRNAIDCELQLRFVSLEDPRLLERRQRLVKLFGAVPVSQAEKFRSELVLKSSSLSKRFHFRLATATRNQMLGILQKLPCQAFFKEYELRFNPLADTFSIGTNPGMTSAEKDQRKRDVNALISGGLSSSAPLWQRLRARAQAALARKVPASFPALTAPVIAAVTRLSKVQISLHRAAFPDGTGGIRFEAFQRCFEQFANGELRAPPVAGHPGLFEPNGAAYFLFAEFAFLCDELNIDSAIWAKALQTFVKTQEIFIHVYRDNPRSVPPVVGAPLPPPQLLRPLTVFANGNFTPLGASISVGKGQSSPSRKAALRAKYDAMGVRELKEAARDNLWRALRTP